MNLINHHFPKRRAGGSSHVFQHNTQQHYWKESPRERDREGEIQKAKAREGKETEEDEGERERERDCEGESPREDWSPLSNDRIPVKLAQAEGSDYTRLLGDPKPVCGSERS